MTSTKFPTALDARRNEDGDAHQSRTRAGESSAQTIDDSARRRQHAALRGTGGGVPVTAPPLHGTASVGGLVRHTMRDCQAVLTDIRDGVASLRRRYGGGLAEPWPAQWATITLLARRGMWQDH